MDHYTSFAIKYIFLNTILVIAVGLVDKYMINGRKIHIIFGNGLKRVVKGCTTALKSERLFICIAVLICICNAFFLFDNALWGDEGFSAILVRNNISGILKGTAADVHPPLYYLLLKCMVSLFGESGIVLHLTSYIAFLCCCLLVITFVRKRMGLIPAYFAIMLTGWTGMGMVYSIEIRMYSMTLLFVTLTFCAAYQVLTEKKMRYWIEMSIFALLGAYTHYFALLEVAFIMSGVYVYAIVKKQKDVWKKIFITIMLCIVGYIPWLTSLLMTLKHTVKDFWLQAVPSFAESMDLVFGRMNYSRGLYLCFIALLFIKVIMQIVTIRREKESTDIYIKYTVDRDNNSLFMVWIALWSIIGTILFGILFSKVVRPVMLTRYLFPMTTMAGISLGIMVNYFMKQKKWAPIMGIATVTMLVFMSVAGIQEYIKRYDTYQIYRDETTDTVEILNNEIDNGCQIVSDIDHFNWTVLEYYFPQMHKNFYSLFEEAEPDKAVALLQNEISNETHEKIESLGYTVSPLGTGRLDDTVCYIYYLEK